MGRALAQPVAATRSASCMRMARTPASLKYGTPSVRSNKVERLRSVPALVAR